MKKSIFLFFAAILCATSAWGNTTFQAGEILFYDFSAITGGANWSWNNGGGLAYDPNAQNSVKAIIFTASETWNPNKVIAKTDKGGWAEIKFKDRTAGTNCIKISADGKSYTWTTHSIEEDILSGKYIMVYGGELNSWSQSEYYFLLNNDANQEQKAAAVKAKLSITISSESYKMGPALLPAGTTSYYQGHWNSGLKCSVEAGSAYVVRNSTTKTNYTRKAQSGSNYLYQVKQNSTAPTTTLSPTCPTKILQGEKLSFSHGEAGVSVVGKTNTVKYYLQNGTTYTEKTLTDGTIDVSDLPAGNYSIITLLYDGYIYVKASTSNFTIESAYDVTFANDGNGTTNQTGTIKVGSSTGIVIDATPSTDYEFKAWESSNGGSFATTAADASNTFYPTANTTLTATFRSTAVNALLVVAGENITSVTGSAEPVTLGSSYPISATFPAGYKFTTWTAEPAANATFADAASATTDVTVLNGSVTVTASAEEVLSTLTTANEYNEGTPTIAAPTASVAKIGVTTTATVTAAAGTGYTFAGWKLDNCVRTDAGADNATTITVKSNGDGADAKVTAKYEQNVVYFVNTKGWSTVKVYAWNDGGASNAAWSGVALTDANIVKQIGGCDVYKYVPGANYAKVIFNNGSEQTDDLAWQNGKYYVYNSENTKDVSDWYTEAEVEGVLPDPVQLTYTVEVPAGTHECYIAGGMNGWQLTKMNPVDATHFTLTIQWATNADKYKYASGPDWAYVEVKADGGEVADRTYNANDKVAKWSAVYNPSATVYDYYVVGTMNEWTQNDENYGMSKVGETTTYSKELTLAAGTYKFKVKGTAWYGYPDIPSEYTEISAEKDGEGNPTGNIQLTLAAEKTFTVNFDSNTKKITFTGLTEIIPTYTVAGDSEAAFGTTWDPTNTANDMALEGGLYKWTKTNVALYANTKISFKVVKNHDWNKGQWPERDGENDNNWILQDGITADGLYTITITFNESTKEIQATATKTGDIVIKDFSNQPATLYFHPSFHWTSDYAQFAAYFYNNGPGADATPTWVNMTDANSDGIYEVANAKQHEYVIICRMNPGRAENNWEDEVMWNQIEHGITIPNTAGDLNTCLAFWTNCQGDVPTSECTWVAPTPLTDKNWDAFIAAYNGKTINAVVERSFNSGQNHTLCLPFNLPTSWLGDGSKAYQLNSIFANTAEELQLNASECNTIEAGKPYIIVPIKGSEYEHIIVSGVIVEDVDAGTNVATGDGYKATLKAVTTTGGQTNGTTEYYVGANDGKLYNAVVDKLGLRAIIELTTTSGQALPAHVRARVVNSENAATGLDNITNGENTTIKTIENGQLIIIRNGEKFNAQGVRF